MKLILLTHSNEFRRPSNTGQLVVRYANAYLAPANVMHCRVIPWSRTQPCPNLLALCRLPSTALLSTLGESVHLETVQWRRTIDSVILLDGTWQEARKIYNRSPYLHHLPRIILQPDQGSRFDLRANQVPGGLSTVESVIELLRLQQQPLHANALNRRFLDFMQSIR